ncbi:hypothetical protein B7P43_G12338 [Cryptotermes secundus]|uniref:Uncharacterized protein n=1 Tax=Cryptotermes secundus TaxID=105785 RepID=A0A2J7QYI5_9NEOP|nr:hypothetical protein B7P43_G12338 [Cryptotermes secundus]
MPLLHGGSSLCRRWPIVSSERPSSPCSSYHIVPSMNFPDGIILTPCHSCTVGRSISRIYQFSLWVTLFLGKVLLYNVSLASCHCCTVAHPSAGDGQFLLGFTISPCRILLFLVAALCSQFSVPTPFLLRFCERHYFGVYYGYLFFLRSLRFPAR